MKTTKKILALFFVAATMMFTACSEKENDNPAIQLAGTGWESSIQNSTTISGVNMNLELQLVMDFKSDKEGELYAYISIEVPAMPAANQTQDMIDPFTYTFKGNTLTITSNDENGEDSDMVLTYNPADNTFTAPIPPDMTDGMDPQQLLGTDHVVFHQAR